MEGEQMATKTKHTKGRVEVHEGEDYVVVMGKNHTTDNYLARVDTVANAKRIALTWNTFDQAREALKRAQRALLLCEKCIPEKHYMNHGCYTQEHARMSIQEIGDVLTSMEYPHETAGTDCPCYERKEP